MDDQERGELARPCSIAHATATNKWTCFPCYDNEPCSNFVRQPSCMPGLEYQKDGLLVGQSLFPGSTSGPTTPPTPPNPLEIYNNVWHFYVFLLGPVSKHTLWFWLLASNMIKREKDSICANSSEWLVAQLQIKRWRIRRRQVESIYFMNK